MATRSIVSTLALAALLILLAPAVSATHGAPGSTDNDNPDAWVASTYTVDLAEDLSSFTLEAKFGIHKLVVNGTTHTAASLRTAYNGAGSLAERNTAMAPIRGAVRAAADTTLAAMAGTGGTAIYLQTPTEEPATFSASSGPAGYTFRAHVVLPGTEEGLGAYTANEIKAVFKAGADVTVKRTFRALPGHVNTFLLVPPSFANFTTAAAPGTVLADGTARIVLDAADRANAQGPLTRSKVEFTLSDTSLPAAPTKESVTVGSTVTIKEFELNPDGTCCRDGLPLTAEAAVDVRALFVSSKLASLPGTVPPAVSLPSYLTADGFRALRSVDIITDAQVAEAETEMNADVKADMEASFGPGVTVTRKLSLDAGIAGTGPIRYVASTNTVYHDIDVDSNTADAGLDAGATVTFPLTLEEGADRQHVFTVKLPPSLAFMDAPSPKGGATRTFDVPDATHTVTVQLAVGNPTADRPTKEVIRNAVTLRIEPFAGSQEKALPIAVTVTADAESLAVGDRFPGVLPERVNLPFVSAHGVRLLRDRGVITQAHLDTAATKLLASVEETMTATFGTASNVAGGFETDSLAPSLARRTPIAFEATAAVTREIAVPADHVDAALDAGALLRLDVQANTEAGETSTYTLVLPPGLRFFVDGVPGTDTLVQVADNAAGTAPLAVPLMGRIGKDVARPTHADVTVTVDVALEPFRTGVAGIPLKVNVEASLVALDAAGSLGDRIPGDVELPYLSADGLRALHQRGVLTSEDLGNASKRLGENVSARLEAALGAPVAVESRLDEASTAAGATGPVRMTATVTGAKPLPGATPEQAEVVLASGALARLDLPLKGFAKSNLTYTVSLPESLGFKEATGGTLDGNRKLLVRIDAWNLDEAPTAEVKAVLHNPQAATFTAQDARIEITLDMSLDMTLGDALNKQGDMIIDLDAAVILGVMEVPEEVREKLPSTIEMQYLPADGLRRLYQVGALNETQVATLERKFLDRVSEGLSGFAGGPVVVEGGIDRADLQKVGPGQLAGLDPVRLTASAVIRRPLSGGGGSGGAEEPAPQVLAPGHSLQGLTLASFPLSLTLKSFEGLPTTYSLILPKGIEVVDPDAGPDAQWVTEEGPDGRQILRISVAGGKEAPTSMSLAVTPTLLVDQFLGWILLACAVILLVFGGIGYGVYRLVRRGKKQAPPEPPVG